MTEATKLEIECPHCATNNTYPLPVGIKCQQCGGVLTNSIYKTKLVSGWTVLILGIGGTLGATHLLNEERYPMDVEHAIIETCINRFDGYMTQSRILEEREKCICALKKTQPDFELKERNSKAFTSTFNKNMQTCPD